MSSSLHDHPHLPPPRTQEVAQDVFAYVQPDGSWFINNTGFIRSPERVLAIDTCATERRTRGFLAAIEAVAGDRPRMLVNTHHHGDHTNGNSLLPAAAVFGHEQCREEMQRSGIVRPDGLFEPVEWGEVALAPPFVTFRNELTIHLDDLAIELIHLTSAAHTNNDVVAWIPEHRVLFSGDLVLQGATPFVLMGSVAGSLEALDCIMELDPAIIVPGHGSPCGTEALETCGRYLRWLQTSAEALAASGHTPLQAARELDLGEFAELQHPERLAGNLHRAFAELGGARPGSAIDYSSAFADMIELNGGRPLTCYA